MYHHHKTPSTSLIGSYSKSSRIGLRTNAYAIRDQETPLYRYSCRFERDGETSREEASEMEEGEIEEPKKNPLLARDQAMFLKEFLKEKSSQIFRTETGQIVPHSIKLDDMILYTRIKIDIDRKFSWTSSSGIKLLVCLKYEQSITSSDQKNYLKSLNTIIRHKASMEMLNFDQNFFWPTATTKDRLNIDSMIDCAFGIYISGAMLTKRGPAIILDHTAAALTKSGNLINLLESFRNASEGKMDRAPKRSRTIQPLQFMQPHDKLIEQFCSNIVDLKCYVRHMKHKQIFRIKKFTQASADSTKFHWDEENCDVTISEYFFRKHSIRLRYSNLPCLIKGNNDRQAMYPFELCYLIEDQKIKRIRLNMDIAKRLDQTREPPIANICPDKRSQYSQDARQKFIALSKAHLDSFNIDLSTKPLVADGRIIDPPALQYRDDKIIIPKDGRWKAQKFIKSLNINHWCVVNTTTTTGMDEIRFFIEGLRNYSFIYFGLSMDRPHYKDISSTCVDENVIRRVVSDCMTHGPQLILFVVKEKNEIYSYIHLVNDIVYGINATCIQEKNIRPTSRPGETRMRFSTPVLTNLSQKINAKLGGINMIQAREDTSNELVDAMFVGCDVTHPDSNTSDASIAACVASCSFDFFQYITSIQVQGKNEEIVSNIDKMMEELLRIYKTKNNRLPSKIFFYRDGVSNDQFDQVRQLEINKMRQFFSMLYTSESCPMPLLTFIVVQKRHRMRFFQEVPSQASLKNPSPGTIIDNTVTGPNDDEFYLYSHWNTKGTSRPSHYHVISNDSGYSMERLQKITYFMCHTYARCAQSISLPAVVRYAHLAAYRARLLMPKSPFVNRELRDTMYFC